MIKGTNIVIRAIAEKDLDELILKLGDSESLGEFLPSGFISESKFKQEYREHGFIREGSERYIATSKENQVLGSIWLFKSIPYFDSLEIGYHIFDRDSRNKGHATECVKLLTDFVFEFRQINRLEIRMAVGNIASERVAVKAGFTHEGVLREAAFSQGKHHDMHTYSLLRREWAAKKGLQRIPDTRLEGQYN